MKSTTMLRLSRPSSAAFRLCRSSKYGTLSPAWPNVFSSALPLMQRCQCPTNTITGRSYFASTGAIASSSSFLRPQRGPQRSIPQQQQQQQRRTLFIAVEETPNPASLKFFPTGTRVMPEGMNKDFPNPLSAFSSPLAKALFQVDGVRGVYLAPDFITITKTAEFTWSSLKLEIFEAIENFFASGRPVITEDAIQNEDTAAQEDDDEVLIAIKEILETRVRPMVQEDGGDIHFIEFTDGVVKLQMQGSCSGCPSSTATLKLGIENMLKHYVPEVEEVISIDATQDPVAVAQFERTEQEIAAREAQDQQH